MLPGIIEASRFQGNIAAFSSERFMRLCIALIPSRTHEHGWHPCQRLAPRGDRYCLAHRDALNGIVMGYLATDISRHAKLQRKLENAAPPAFLSEFLASSRIQVVAAQSAGPAYRNTGHERIARRASRNRRRTANKKEVASAQTAKFHAADR
jgi:hypothetical protein